MSEERRQQGRKIPEVLTTQEQGALLRQPNPRYPTGERNRLMLSLMLNTGLRLSEATGLRWREIDLNSGKVMVRQGKGAKDRTLWVGEDDLRRLRRWRERQAKEIAGAPSHVFTTLKGSPVSNRYVQEVVKRLAQKAGIDKDVHPHMLRHTFATDLYRQTTNIRLTQKALGHSNLATTQIYTHIVDEELEEALKSFRGERGVRSMIVAPLR
jgi:site-specific recombinase XerD